MGNTFIFTSLCDYGRLLGDLLTLSNNVQVLVGAVEHQSLLNTLDLFEDSILDDVPGLNTPFKRPWIDSQQPPILEKSTLEFVDFPEEDESMGEITISFQGPLYGNSEHCKLQDDQNCWVFYS